MQFIATANTDIGISRASNQDSLLIKHALIDEQEVLMAIVCDGMGGLSKGELASATVIRSFSRWFDEEFAEEAQNVNPEVIGEQWSLRLRELNTRLLEYSRRNGIEGLGTTFTGALFFGDEYVLVHVGDTRAYHIGATLRQLTKDQTFVAREIERGTMTLEQAKVDRRRNLLLQCVGASKTVTPQILVGKTEKGTYLLCSDGFRHELTEEELYDSFKPADLTDKNIMHERAWSRIELVKRRGERDNISALLVRAE